MKKSLQSDEYVLTLLTACIKKSGGEISLTEEEIDAGSTKIRSIVDLDTNKRIAAKDLQGQSFAHAFGVKE